MAYLSDSEIETLRNRVDIVDIVSSYIPLQNKGRNKVCQCPFHDDHDPSLTISQDKQIFKCFVCGTGGNVFTFVQKIENISFIEAVYKIAQLSNFELSKPYESINIKKNNDFMHLYRVLEMMIEYTNYQLKSPTSRFALEYLHKRGLTNEIIQKYQIGYDVGHDNVYKFLKAKKQKEGDLFDVGIIGINEHGAYDVFSNRITIPIHDFNGNPIGFTARSIDTNAIAKYINTSTTKLYEKGNVIFNYHRVKSISLNIDSVFLVEGAMDVLAFEKVGIPNVVATLGTACTKQQLKLLRQLHKDIIVFYDGDQAGKHAIYKFGKLANHQISFAIAKNPYELDPDEIINTYGKELFLSITKQSIGWIDFLFDYLLSKYELENYTDKKNYFIEISEEIYKLPNRFERENYIFRLQELTGFNMNHSREKDFSFSKPKSDIRNFNIQIQRGRTIAQYEIIGQMLCGIKAVQIFSDELGFLPDEDCNLLSMYIIDYYRNHESMNISHLYDCIKEAALQDLLLSIVQREFSPEEVSIHVLKDAIIKIKCSVIDEELDAMKKEIKESIDPLLKAKLADRRNYLIRQRKQLFEIESDNEM